MRRTIKVLLLIFMVLAMVSPVFSMSSAALLIDWLIPLTGTGGVSSSDRFEVSLTVGQAVTGSQTGASYQSGLGFWYGEPFEAHIYAPQIRK